MKNRNTKWYITAFTLIAFLCIISQRKAYAQNTIIEGKITDTVGEPLPGVIILIDNTTQGTTTDLNGSFSFTTNKENLPVTISMLGYETVRTNISKSSNNLIKLLESYSKLDEVVVIGYGYVTKKETTGAVSVVKGDKISQMAVSDATQALQGLASGVTVSSSSNSPGASPVVRIRGIGSITGSNSPLYVVDGLPQNDISYLNPNDIESLTIHKDASVAAIYGARAANGVIVVTTKKGSLEGKVQVNYDGYIGVQSPDKRANMLDAKGFIEYKSIAAVNAGNPIHPDFDTSQKVEEVLSFVKSNSGVKGTNWWDEIMRYNAKIQDHNISVKSGNKSNNLFTSLNYFNQNGIAEGSDYERISWRTNTSTEINKRVKLDLSFGVIKGKKHLIDENNPFSGTIFSGLVADPITPVYRTNLINIPASLSRIMNGYEANNLYSQHAGILYSNKLNPVGQTYRMEQSKYETLTLKGGANLNVEILKGLTFNTRFGIDINKDKTTGFMPRYSLNSYDYSTENRVSNYFNFSDYYVTENTLSYDVLISGLNIKTLAGVSAEKRDGSQTGAYREGIVNNDVNMRIINAGTINDHAEGYIYSQSTASYFGRINLNYEDKYFLSFNLRRDGSSNFAPEYRWGTFPSISGAWYFTEEPFYKKNSSVLYSGKLRVSYGLIGNQNIGGGAYRSNYGTYIYDRYLFGSPTSAPSIGAGRQSAGNIGLKWETSKQFDVGIDLTFFNGRFRFTADYFNKTIEDMLLRVPVAFSLGYPNYPYSNAGTMENKGFEFDLAYDNKIGELEYTISGNISTYQNKVKSLGTGQAIFNGKDNFNIDSDLTKTEVGQPVGYFYGYNTNGIFQNAREVEDSPQRDVSVPGDIRYKDVNGDERIDANDRSKIGDPWPDFVYGFTANIAYKGFDFNMFWQGSQGNEIFNIQRYFTESGTGYYNAPADFIKRSWQGEGTTSRFHRISEEQNLNGLVSDYYIEDGSYLKLKSIQLGYDFTQTLLSINNISKLRIYIAAQNLLTISRYSGFDPEIGSSSPTLSGIDSGFYPQARVFTIGINATF